MLGKSAKEIVTGRRVKSGAAGLDAVHRNIRGVDSSENIIGLEFSQYALCPDAVGKHENLFVRNPCQRVEFFHSKPTIV